jgi:hypothetical protein
VGRGQGAAATASGRRSPDCCDRRQGIRPIGHNTARQSPPEPQPGTIIIGGVSIAAFQETLSRRPQRRQTRVEALPASEICSSNPEDALFATLLRSLDAALLGLHFQNANKPNDDQPAPTRPNCRPTEGQRIVLSHPTH